MRQRLVGFGGSAKECAADLGLAWRFATILVDGSVVNWKHDACCGIGSVVQDQLWDARQRSEL